MTAETRARFEINPQVLHESIDGEVIVIDLATGIYYSLRDSAADVWSLVQGSPGVAAEDVAAALATRYEAAAPEVEGSVLRFLGELEREGLVRPVTASAAAVLPAQSHNGSAAKVFSPPALEKFTDMQDLVLLDPVHEVDERGWPHVRPSSAPGDDDSA